MSWWDSPYAGYIKIAAASITWGTLGLIVRALPVPTQTIVFFRVTFSLPVILLVMLAGHRINDLRVKKHRLLLLFSGIMLGLNWVSYFYALRLTTVANAVLVSYTYPIIVAILAPIFLQEKLELTTVFSLVLSLVGIILIVQPENLAFQPREIQGILFALVAAATSAAVVIAAKRILPHITSYALMFYQALITAIMLFPFAFARPLHITSRSWILLVLMGVVHSTAAYYLYYSGLRVVRAQRASILTYLEPVSAATFAAIFLGEKPGWLTMVGGILILSAGFNVVRRHARTQPPVPD